MTNKENRKIIAYEVVEASTKLKLIEQVEGFISKGFQPFGSCSQVYGDGNFYFTQAMVKYEDLEKESEKNLENSKIKLTAICKTRHGGINLELHAYGIIQELLFFDDSRLIEQFENNKEYDVIIKERKK